MSAPIYHIRDIALHARDVTLRLPFRFGDTEVRAAQEAYLRVTVEGPEGVQKGTAAQLMVPRWFDKRPALDNDATVAELKATLGSVARLAPGRSGTVARLGGELRASVRDDLPPDTPGLAAGFGPALLEAALIDAACRGADLPFVAAARADIFGLVEAAPDWLGADAMQAALADLHTPDRMMIRHTVGYGVPLTAADVTDRPTDGQPVALQDVIGAWGVRAFKIKLKGDPEADIAWLERVAAILAPLGPGLKISLDANEQYAPESFADFTARLTAAPALAGLRADLLFVEQPFPRELSLVAAHPVSADVPIVIDEADDAPDALYRALALGWSGSSVKSCKGVLRAVQNFALARRRAAEGRPIILTSEDLTCQPGLSWQQDTLMAAAIGATHSERNGHYFAGGMQGASDAEKAAFLSRHGDIYRDGPAGPQLRITDGRVAIGSLDCTGFGAAVQPDLASTPELEF
ncbi:enolase C-terminal domain-like protein [Oceanomicrobium pacificus]|uniref:Mandelate racemase n=1 Tax=Oceanomicrobium pacificus TaxID=2692916 RepID=A0A6B0TYY3_9RHOB|nr:enolase C-terminal domain-like protein [Oceanomicrobium pacificus]MXU66223.1 mandelate racemase [Oceanomicrobium pacificus]